MLSVWEAPVSEASTRLIDGWVGAVASMVTGRASEAAETLPAVSVAVAVKECAPAVAWVVRVQSPLVLAVAVPTQAGPSQTSTVLPASAGAGGAGGGAG